MMHDKKKTTSVCFDIKFIRLDQKHVGLARQASPFIRYFGSCLISLISKDTNMVFPISDAARSCNKPKKLKEEKNGSQTPLRFLSL